MAKGEWTRTTRIIEEAAKILEAENPMTLRQCFYRLVSIEIIENTRKDYQGLSSILTKARNDGRVEFDWIVDRSRPAYSPNVFENAAEYAETVRNAYRKDYWSAQPYYCEIWTEKDSISGSIKPITDKLGVTIRVGRGFLSTTRAHETADHFRSIDKPIRVFYLGDFDPSGVAIEEDVAARVRKYRARFQIKRLAIHHADIAKFHLPPLRVKNSDSRSKEFKRKHGREAVELDALPVGELRKRIEAAISGLIDHDVWNRAVSVEKVELACIANSMSRWNSLPGMDGAA